MMTHASLFLLLSTLLLLLLTPISSQLNIVQPDNFNCDAQIPRDRYIKVYVRFPQDLGPWSTPGPWSNNQNNAINIIESFRKMENHLLSQFNVNVRFTFGAPLLVQNGIVQCGPSGGYPDGVEYLFCDKDDLKISFINNNESTSGNYPPMTSTSSGCDLWTTGSRPWLRNTLKQFRVNALFGAMSGAFLLPLSTDLMKRGINPFFPSCSNTALQCLPSFSYMTCGDGILQFDEECEPSALISRGYFSDIPLSILEGICKPDCTRVQGNVSTSARGGEWFNSVVWSGSAAKNTMETYMQSCLKGACGYNSLEIIDYSYGQWIERPLDIFRYCDGHIIDDSVCVTLITSDYNPHPVVGYGTPLTSRQPALYAPLQCYGFNGCNKITPEIVWRCRTSLTSPWVPCSGDQSDVSAPYWTLREPIEGTLNDETVGYLGFNQFIDVATIPNFICGPLYRRRQVACIRTGDKNTIIRDAECSSSPRPAGVIAIQPKPCVALHHVTRYGFEANTPEVPSLVDFQRSDYITAVPPVIPNRPIKCPVNGAKGNAFECFQSCASRHIRFFQCAQSPRLSYSTSSRYPIGSFTPTAVTDTVLAGRYCNDIVQTQAVTQEGAPNCEYLWLCSNDNPLDPTSYMQCQKHNQCKCSNPDEVTLTPKCISRPASDYSAGVGSLPALASANSPCPDQDLPIGSSPLAYNPLLNGDNIPISCLKTKQDQGCYGVKLKYTQQDESHPTSSTGYPSDYARNPLYDDYCVLSSFNRDVFTPVCWNIVSNQETTTGCTESMFEKALACSLSFEKLICSVSLDTNYGPDNVNTPLSVSLLPTHAGYDATTASSEMYCTAEGIISSNLIKKRTSYCGKIQFKVTLKGCQKRLDDNQFTTVPTSQCTQPVETVVTTHGGAHCAWECYDMAPSTTNPLTSIARNVHIGQCSVQNPPNPSLMRCGSLTDMDNCSFVQKVYDVRCQYVFNGQLFTANTSNDVCSSSTYPITQPQPCFKITSKLSFDSPLSYDDYKVLQQTTQSNPQCQFRTLCSYHYVEESKTLTTPISSLAPIPSSQWSTYACAHPFDCNQQGVCGAVRRTNACGLFKGNSPVHVVGPYPSTSPSSFSLLDIFAQSFITMVNSQDEFGNVMSAPTSYSFSHDDSYEGEENEIIENENENDDYHNDFNTSSSQNGENGSNNPNGPNLFSSLQTGSKASFETQMDIFLSAGRGSSCGIVRAKTDGCAASGTQNCFVPRCYLHHLFLHQHSETPLSFNPSTLSNSQFTEANCEDFTIEKHCLTGLPLVTPNKLCDRVQFRVFYRCFDVFTGELADPSDCGLEAKSDTRPLGYFEKLCSIVNGCTEFEEKCAWKSNNPNVPQIDLRPGHIVMSSQDPEGSFISDAVDFDCADISDIKGDEVATNTLCSNLLFCGKAKTFSFCRFRGTNFEGSSEIEFHLDAPLCRAFAQRPNAGELGRNFVDYGLEQSAIQCENFFGCSSWACSTSGSESAIPSLKTIQSYTNLSTITSLATRSFFNDVTGVIRAENCAAGIVADGFCGVGVNKRQVGCLIRKSADLFTIPTFDFDPTATHCGSPHSSLFKKVPLEQYTSYSTSGCKKVLECGAGGAEHGPNNCDYLHCPAVYSIDSTATSFSYPYDLRCQGDDANAAQQGAILPLVECSSTLDGIPTSIAGKPIPISTQCQYIQQYCKTNLRVPMGFGINSNVTNIDGKFVPENRSPTDPTTLKFFLDSSCTESASLSLVTLFDTVGNKINANLTLAEGDKFNLGLNYNWHSYSLIFNVYLLSSESTPQSFPYFIQQLPPSPNPHYSITIPTWIPNGQYMVVVYGNMLMINILKDQYITIKRTTPLTLAPLISPTPPSPTPTTIDGISGQCAGFLCLNGSCVLPNGAVMPPNLTPSEPGSNYQCQCNPGFSGKYCAQSTRCDAEAAAAANQTPGSLKCDLKYGIVGPSITSTKYNPSQDVNTCDTCICLGPFGGVGCQKCQLQCGLGTSDASCSKCNCPKNRSGAFCECSSKRFTIFHRLPPPFIQSMFKRGDSQYDPVSHEEQAQLIAWKKNVIADIANDLAIPANSFEIESYGSIANAFGIVIKITLCQPYQKITQSVSMEQSNNEQKIALDLLFSNFEQAYALLVTHTSTHAPLSGYSNDEEDHLQYYKPSFDYQTFVTRFGVNKPAKNSIGEFFDQNDKLLNEKLLNENSLNDLSISTLFDDEEELSPSPSLIQSISSFQTLDIAPTIADKYQFTQASVAASPVTDAGGGFSSLSSTYSSTSCDGIDTTCINPPHESLSPTMPAEWKKKPKPFDKKILLYIFLPLLLVLLTICAALLCCSWHYQIWCFKDFMINRERERKQRREEFRTKRSGTTPNAVSTAEKSITPTTVASTTPTTTNTALAATNTIIIDAGQGANAGLTADYHPDDFDNQEEADCFAADSQIHITTADGDTVGQRQSICIGGMKRVSVMGLPKGWSALHLDGRQIFVNTETMQSSSVQPREDGSIPIHQEDKGW